jgi:hypothetical protein
LGTKRERDKEKIDKKLRRLINYSIIVIYIF